MFRYLTNIFSLRCPRCYKGKLYSSSAYNLKEFIKMPERCECCGQEFELEPSFFYGAMYVSYALQVALLVTVFVAYQVLYPAADALTMIITVIGIAAVLYPLLLRLSRSIWIHFFVKHDSEIEKNCDCQ